MKKRILTAVLALCVAFTSIPADMSVYAQTTEVTEAGEAVESEEQAETEETTVEQALESSEIAEGATEGGEESEASEMADKAESDEVTEQSAVETEETEQSVTETEMTEELATETEATEVTEQPVTETEATEVTEQPVTETETTEETEQPVTETETTESSQMTEVETNVTDVTDKSPMAETNGLLGNVTENIEEIASTETEEDTETEENDEIEAELNFILVESDYIETPGTQKVVASVGTEEMKLEDLMLTYRNTTTKEEFQTEATDMVEDMALFEMNFEKESQSGTYQLLSITYTLDGKEYTIKLSEQEMDIRFGVNKEVETNPDQLLVEEGADIDYDANVGADVVTMDENGNIVSEATVENVLAEGSGLAETFDSVKTYGASAKGDELIVVLDPGHDTTHGNANKLDGVTEEQIVLKIAKYCKEELETYAGVKVYLTRESAACPFTGATTAAQCLQKRAEYAKNVGADVLVSLHLNSVVGATASGVEVYYPSTESSYNKQVAEDGKEVASDILDKLVALGLYKRGTGIKVTTTTGEKYADGSNGDSYLIIRESRKNGIPAVIVEHAFLYGGPTDYANFLNSDEKLKKLGVADAQGIAETYGLSKKGKEKPVISYTQSRTDGTIKIKWKAVSNATSYEVYRRKDGDSLLTLVETTTDTSFIDKKVTAGTKYYYQIKALFGSTEASTESAFVEGCALEKAEISYVKSSSSKKLKISWNKVENASGYKIYRQNESTGEYEEIAKIESGETTTYTDKVDVNNKKYYYKVQAYQIINGKEGVGPKGRGTGGKALAKPTIKTVTSEDKDEIEITWKKVDGASGYIITRSTKKDSGFKEIATITSGKTVSYVDKEIKTGKTYYYKLEAYNKVGTEKGYSGKTSAVAGKTIAKTSINYVISKDSNTLEINWNKVEGAWGYRVKRRAATEDGYKTIATVEGQKKNSYKDKTVETGTKYYYKVETIAKVNGSKIYSGSCSAVSGKALKTTSITAVKAESSKKITLTWEKVSGVTGYRIYRSTSKNGTYEKVKTIDSYKTTSYTDNKVKAGKTYYYKIQTYKKKGNKTELSSYSSKQKAVTVKKVEISKVSSNDSKKVTLNWKKVSNADGYRITRSTKKSSGFKTIAEVTSGDVLKYTDKNVKAGKTYYYRVTALVEGKGDKIGRGDYSNTIEVPVLAKVKISSIKLQEGNALKVKWSESNDADGYQLLASTKEDGEYSSVKKTSSKSYTHKNLTEGTTYYYKVRAYAKLSNGNTIYSAWSTIKSQSTGHEIMGKSNVTVDDMMAYYNARHSYPVDTYKEKGAKNAKEFFKILKEEAEAEGVKTEVLFAQVMLETGGLQFGGDVKPEQCNFGGLGATGGGVGGATFKDVRTGLRAQVQHLKAYACDDDLENECVDTRFKYVKRNSAPYIEWLSIPNNPYGAGWAMDNNYAAKLLSIMNKL